MMGAKSVLQPEHWPSLFSIGCRMKWLVAAARALQAPQPADCLSLSLPAFQRKLDFWTGYQSSMFALALTALSQWVRQRQECQEQLERLEWLEQRSSLLQWVRRQLQQQILHSEEPVITQRRLDCRCLKAS